MTGQTRPAARRCWAAACPPCPRTAARSGRRCRRSRRAQAAGRAGPANGPGIRPRRASARRCPTAGSGRAVPHNQRASCPAAVPARGASGRRAGPRSRHAGRRTAPPGRGRASAAPAHIGSPSRRHPPARARQVFCPWATPWLPLRGSCRPQATEGENFISTRNFPAMARFSPPPAPGGGRECVTHP